MPTSESVAAYQPGVSHEDLQLIIEKTPDNVWDALRDQRIFISGGTGFVGCWLLEALLWANQTLNLNLSISVLSRKPNAFIAKAPHLALHHCVKLIKGDVNNLADISGPYDVIIHAATDVVNAETDSLSAYNSIVNGTQQTLELARRSKARRYLLTSSGAVYGSQPATLTHIPESYAGAPDTKIISSAYGHAKRISEWLSFYSAQQYGLEVQIARCFAVIGPYLPLDAQFAVGNFIKDGLDNKAIAVNGDGTAVRSYLYAADMTIWLLTILINGQQGQHYNLGSANALTIKELADTVSQIIYKKNKVTLASQPSEQNVIQRYVPDISKAKHELKLEQHTDLDAAIIKTIEWEVHRRALAHSRLDDNNMKTFAPQKLRKTVLQMAFSGSTVHVGCAFSIIEILAVLYRNHLRYPDDNPNAAARDYLVLSKGHGVMAQYACLYEKNWLTQHDIENYFKDGSKLKGLSDAHVVGCEVTSGSLGHGLSVGVGMALAAKLNKSDQYCYAIVGDGEMNEGTMWEALLFAKHQALDNLVVIVDENGFQAMGTTEEVLTLGDLPNKFTAFGFETLAVDGHDEVALDNALTQLKNNKNGLPKAIIARTVKGKGVSFMENQNIWHYTRLTHETFGLAISELEQSK